MRRSTLFLVLLLSGILESAAWGAAGGGGRQPVYLGARGCAQCHTDAAIGHQAGTWRASAHARAYAVLSNPEAKTIAELSGITEEIGRASCRERV